MPLKSGKSKNTVSSNIREILHNFKEKGSIGKIKNIKSPEKARKIAAAIVYRKKREG